MLPRLCRVLAYKCLSATILILCIRGSMSSMNIPEIASASSLVSQMCLGHTMKTPNALNYRTRLQLNYSRVLHDCRGLGLGFRGLALGFRVN